MWNKNSFIKTQYERTAHQKAEIFPIEFIVRNIASSLTKDLEFLKELF